VTEERLTVILQTWRAWQRRPNTNIGFPPRAIPFMAGGAYDGDSDYAAADDEESRIVQAAVDDLPGPEQSAVYNVIMGTRRPLGEPLEVVYLRARAMLKIALNRRGVE
jgi:hypothetical protein